MFYSIHWKCGAKWWQSMTGLNIRDESHIQESRSDEAIVINYCILYAKQYIYLEKLKGNKNQNTLNIVFVGYMYKLKYILKIEKNIYVFTVIKVLSLICLILYITTYRLYACDILM